MRDAQGRKLSIVEGIPHVEVAPGQFEPYRPAPADLADDERGPWLLNHTNCHVCGNPISLRRVRLAFARGRWPIYCSDTHRERATKQRQRERD